MRTSNAALSCLAVVEVVPEEVARPVRAACRIQAVADMTCARVGVLHVRGLTRPPVRTLYRTLYQLPLLYRIAGESSADSSAITTTGAIRCS